MTETRYKLQYKTILNSTWKNSCVMRAAEETADTLAKLLAQVKEHAREGVTEQKSSYRIVKQEKKTKVCECCGQETETDEWETVEVME